MRIPSWPCAGLQERSAGHSFRRHGIGNLVSLININEQVDYAPMFARGDGRAAALTGFAGPGLANGMLYLLSLVLLR